MRPTNDDPLIIAGEALGSAPDPRHGGYPSPQVMREGAGRERYHDGDRGDPPPGFRRRSVGLLDQLGGRYRLLPNTAAARPRKEAVLTAQLGREALGHELGQARADRRQRDALSRCRRAAGRRRRADRDGFTVLPYCNDDPGDLPQARRSSAARP